MTTPAHAEAQAANNKGHGHVVPRPDGVKARCGGPAMCHVCQAERGTLEATPAVPAPAAPAEPDMRHPKIQALIGAKARREIELQLVEQLLDEGPDCDLTSLDMEYWHGLHDKLREKLTAAQPALAPVARQTMGRLPKALIAAVDEFALCTTNMALQTGRHISHKNSNSHKALMKAIRAYAAGTAAPVAAPAAAQGDAP